MNSLVPVSGALVLLVLAYRFYSRFIANRLFQLDDSRPTPAVTMEDGIDYVPTHKSVVFNLKYVDEDSTDLRYAYDRYRASVSMEWEY